MTSDDQQSFPKDGPTEAFIKQVKDALEHLYDYAYLQRHPLAQTVVPDADQATEAAGQRLRRELIAAIETLNPGPGVPFRASHARPYNLLHLHYVEGMTVQEAARELGLSVRQTYRDLRGAEKGVAAILWSRRSASPLPGSQAARLSSVQAEMNRLETHPRPTDVRQLLQHAHEAVERMASQRAVSLHIEASEEPAIVFADPVLARQVLINMLSQAVQQAQPGALRLTLTSGEEQVVVTWRYVPVPDAASASLLNPITAQLVDRLGWTVQQEDQPGDARTVNLRITVHGPTVLVIDDNEGLVDLLERYLTHYACRVVAATSGQEGLRMAREVAPRAIVLDVMMPEMDGWELLQRLRAHPQTANIPVIICSVFNDPELAYSLGASLFLSKPVSRDDLLTALHQLGIV